MTICVSSGKWFSVLGAILLAGCISIPAAIQETTTTPQQDLNVVKNAPRAFIGQEARFGGTVIHITNGTSKNSKFSINLRLVSK